jgi:glycosyltransferase involved in cell wall biosynthesis
MMHPASDLSVIITCYKEGELLHRAFESVHRQTVQGFQVILVNDCSPDALTDEICQEYSRLPHVSYIRHSSNQGLSGARNTGFEYMTGSIAMPLDADDTFPEDAVEKTLAAFNTFPAADMVFGDYALLNIGYEITEVISCADLADEKRVLNPYKLAANWKLMGQSPCKKTLWQKVNGYSPEFTNTVQDVDFWRRACLAGFEGRYIPSVIYHWRRLETGMNHSVSEENYLPLRIKSLPFYHRFNPEYGKEMRAYIFRYYSSRLMHKELAEFVRRESNHFTLREKLKTKFMQFPLWFKVARKIKNSLP